jgi:hypothetical protein
MKKIYAFLLALSVLCLYKPSSAQETRSTPEIKRAQNVFVEIFGQGLLITANYDTRFQNTRTGLGGRIGIGYIAADGDHATTFPVSLNYLLGKDRRLFEVGLGATLMSAGGSEDSFFLADNQSRLVGTMSFTYRVQPVDGGFSFRVGLTPIFNKDFFMPYFGGLSIGYSF